MAKSEKARLQHTSSPPGTLVHIGKKKRENAQISFFRYNAGSYEEKELSALSELPAHADPGDVWWINIDGLHDISLIEAVGKKSGPNVAELTFTALSEIFKHGIARHVIQANPCMGIMVSAVKSVSSQF